MIRVLAVVEADTITGPVKNLLEFCRQAKQSSAVESVDLVFATYRRPGDPEETNDKFIAAVREAGTDCDIIPEGGRFDLKVIGHLQRIAAARAPDIIQTHSVKSHFLFRLSGLWKRYPWIAFHHGYTWPNLRMKVYNQLDRWSLRKPVHLVTVTKAFEQELVDMGMSRDRISVLHNAIPADWSSGISTDEVAHLRARLAPDGEKLVLAVGRLSAEKAHADLIEALTRLSDSRPDLHWRLTLVGEGPERPRLEAAAARIGGRLRLTGQVGDVRPYYAAADLFVLPSHSEGSPNVLLEAMAAGTPVVATAVGGIPEIVTNEESALLVPTRNIGALARAMERILESPEFARQLTGAASARIRRDYSPEARTRSLARLYSDLLRRV